MPDGKQYIMDIRSNLIHAYGDNQVPSVNDFINKLQNQQYRKDIFDNLKHAYGESELPTFDAFESKLGFAKQVQPVISAQEVVRQEAIPSFKDFAAKNKMPLVQQRAAAEGVYSPNLAKKVQQDYDVATAPERKQKKLEQEAKTKEEALFNTTVKRLNSEGIKFKEGDVVFKRALEDTRKAVDNDLLALTSVNGKPEYLRKLGFWKSLTTTFKETNRQRDLSKMFSDASEDEQIKIAEQESKREIDEIPTGISGVAGESVGMGLVPYSKAIVGGAVGTGLFPGAGTLAGIIGGIAANTEDAYKQGYMSEVIKRYSQDISDMERKGIPITQETKRAAMRRAKELGATAGVLEAGVVAGLSSIPFGSGIAGNSLRNSVKQLIKHSTFDAGRQGVLGISAEMIKSKIAGAKGYNIDTAEEFENALSRGGQEFELGLAMNVMSNTAQFPKYVQSAAKNYLNTIPRPDFNNMSSALEARGDIPAGTTERINSQLDAFQEARAKVPSIIPEEDAPSFAGLIEKKTNLENQKKTADKSMHPKIDEQIEAINTRIQRMMESTDPVKEEVDDLTGATGEAIPYTEENIKADIDIIEPKVKIADVESIRNTLPDEQANTRTQATQKILDYFAETMDIPKFTEELNKGTYIKWLQESGIGDTGYKVSELLNNPKRAFDVITDFSRTKKQFAKPIEEAIAEKVPDAEFESFVDRGTVPQDRIQSIAMKVKDNQPLSERETAIFTAKTGDVNKILETVKAQEEAPKPIKPEKLMRMADIKRLKTIERNKLIEAIGTPTDIRQAVMFSLINGRKINYQSFADELGATGKVKIRGKEMTEAEASPFTDEKGQTIEQAAQDIWEAYDQVYDTQEIRNEIIDVISEYTDMDKLKDEYIAKYSEEDIDAAFEKWYEKTYQDLEPIEKEWELFAEQEGPKMQDLELDPDYVDLLMKQYEPEFKPADEGVAPRETEAARETVVSTDITEAEGGVARTINRATQEEATDFTRYSNEQISRPDFDAEYNANRVGNESKQEYIIRKYCK